MIWFQRVAHSICLLLPSCLLFQIDPTTSMSPCIVSLVSLRMVYAQSSFLFYDSLQVGVCPSISILAVRVAMVGIYIVGGWANIHLVLVETTKK
jgi:hypothetical protein